jgi:diacylglycerol kinase (ATP)
MPDPTTPSLDPPPAAMPADPISPPSCVLLLVNPNARCGGDGVEPLVRTLRDAGVMVWIEAFSGPDEVETDILRGADGADCVLVAGGDGTVSRAGGVLARLGLPLGILPGGTANDLARTLGIPADPSQTAKVILGGHRRRIDLATVNGHPFFNVASIGLSAELADSVDRRRRLSPFGSQS